MVKQKLKRELEEGGIFATMVTEKEERPSGAKTWDDSIAVCFTCSSSYLLYFLFGVLYPLRIMSSSYILAHGSFHLLSSLRMTHFHDMYLLCTALMSI